jgi:membrane fusion protein (multidrug efflux system)
MNMETKPSQFSGAAHADAGTDETPPATKKSGRGRRLVRATALFAVLGVVAYFTYPWLAARWTHVFLDDARIAANMIAVSSEVSGRIISLPVIAGDKVVRGQVLATIDAASASQELKGLEAQVTGVKSQQNQLRSQQGFVRGQVAAKLQAAEAQIAAAQASHAAAEAALQNAQSQFDRVKALAGRNVLSAQQLDDANARLAAATQQERLTAAGILTARANLEVVTAEEAQIGVLDQQIATFDAQVEALSAQIEQKRIDLGRRDIRAEFDGVIDSTFIDAGEYVSPGTRLLIYHDPSTVWVDANVKETEFRRLTPGAAAQITIDAYPDREFRGEVVRIGEAATSQFALLPSPNPSGNFTKVTQRLPARISIEQQDGLLRPGMMVEVSIDVD